MSNRNTEPNSERNNGNETKKDSQLYDVYDQKSDESKFSQSRGESKLLESFRANSLRAPASPNNSNNPTNVPPVFKVPENIPPAPKVDSFGCRFTEMNMDGCFSEDAEMHLREETNVDEMKIQTMYKMVEDCTVRVGGRAVSKKVLYLTNKQAQLFDEEAMKRCFQALDIGEPKFVLKLLPALNLRPQMLISHEERHKTAVSEYTGASTTSSEFCLSDEKVVDYQLLLFMQTVILPLAKVTKALILVNGADDCALSAALAQVVLAEQARLGKDCPFSVIATASEHEVHSRASNPKDTNSIAGQIARQSNSWSRRMKNVHQFHESRNVAAQRCDLTPAASGYIIFESLDYDNEAIPSASSSLNTSPKTNFESVFLSSITQKIPSIGIQSHGVNLSMGYPYLMDLMLRGMPILFLDTFERGFSLHRAPRQLATVIAKESDAFPTISADIVKKLKVLDRALTTESRHLLFDIALQMLTRKWDVYLSKSLTEVYDSSLMAFLHSALTVGVNVAGNTEGDSDAPLWAVIRLHEKLERANRDAHKALVPADLAQRAVDYMLRQEAYYLAKGRLLRVEKWLMKHDPELDFLIPAAIKRREDFLKLCAELEENNGYRVDPKYIDPNIWLSIFNLLTSDTVFTGSLHDVEDIARTIGKVAKIDRLPDSNSLEANKCLRDAWDCVELYHQVADWYKIVTRVCYGILLLTSIAITIVTTIEAKDHSFSSRIPVLILSAISTAVVGYLTFVNPSVKWEQLRMAALEIESNIWMFRTRSGNYRLSSSGVEETAGDSGDGSEKEIHESPDSLLVHTIQQIKSAVLEAASVNTTAFYSNHKPLNLHGQHPPNYQSSMTSSSSLFSFCDFFSSGVLNEMKNVLPNQYANLLPSSSAQDDLDEGKQIPLVDLPKFQQYRERHPNFEKEGMKLVTLLGMLSNDDEDGDLENSSHDDHYEPLQPDHYVKFRIQTILSFYQRRIPTYSRIRNICQMLIVAGSIATGFVAFFDVAIWAVIITVTTTCVSAYLEFHGTNKKIARYSTNVHSLQSLIVWWETLPSIDRLLIGNIDKLVLTCENLLKKEQESWKSTSQTSKLLNKQMGVEDSNGNSGDADA